MIKEERHVAQVSTNDADQVKMHNITLFKSSRKAAMTTTDAASKVESSEKKLQIIDSDMHPYMPEGLNTLIPYMSKAWQKRIGGRLGEGHAVASQFQLKLDILFINSAMGMRTVTSLPW